MAQQEQKGTWYYCNYDKCPDSWINFPASHFIYRRWPGRDVGHRYLACPRCGSSAKIKKENEMQIELSSAYLKAYIQDGKLRKDHANRLESRVIDWINKTAAASYLEHAEGLEDAVRLFMGDMLVSGTTPAVDASNLIASDGHRTFFFRYEPEIEEIVSEIMTCPSGGADYFFSGGMYTDDDGELKEKPPSYFSFNLMFETFNLVAVSETVHKLADELRQGGKEENVE